MLLYYIIVYVGIFQIFQRLHKRQEFSGTGMGLAIVKKIVDHHGGEICVDSELGQGSKFTVILPGVGSQA